MDQAVTIATWLGIVFCVSQSATFSGLNLAVFGISRLRLEVEQQRGSREAARVLELREDSNFLLTTILWGNVATNVALTLLSDSVLAGVAAFLFSTFAITLVGEIGPQAYFSRHALRMASRLAPVLRFYQRLLYPVAKPSAWVLDRWLGPEGVRYYRERDLRLVIQKHIDHDDGDVDRVEGQGALNFLSLDDLTVSQEGELLHPDSIIDLPTVVDLPQFPEIGRSREDPFLRKIHASGRKWVVLTDPGGAPRLLLDADALLREALLGQGVLNPYEFCHRPIVIDDELALLGDVVSSFKVRPERDGDDVVDHDVVLVWGDKPRVITGADLLGRLLRGIAAQDPRSRIGSIPEAP